MSETVPREIEARAVSALLDGVEQGPTALVIEGEAGIGKTTVLLSAAERAAAQGFSVLSTHGSPAEVGYAYAAVADLLGGADDAALSTLPERQRIALDQARGHAEGGGDNGDERTVAAAFCAVIENLAARMPVLLAIDDAQWLDPSSRAVIGFTARRLVRRTALLVTSRTGDPDAAPVPAWPAFPDPDLVTRIQMRPMTLGGLHALITVRCGRTLPRPAVIRIHEVSGGNPMFALELARAEFDASAAASDLPTSLAALVNRRLGHLGDEMHSVLLAAACAAVPTVDVLSRVTRLPAAQVVDSIETAEALGVVRLDGQHVRFAHPLFAAGVAANAAPAGRRATHRALAHVVEQPELRARHLALAATSSDDSTLAALDAAADVLARRGALAAAAELIDLALDRGGDTPQRRIRAAELHFRSGSVPQAQAYLRNVLADLPPGALRAVALAHLGAIRAYDEDLNGAIQALFEAAADATEVPALRLLCLTRLALALGVADRMGDAADCARQAVDLGRELDVPGMLSQALSIWVLTTFIQGGGIDQDALRTAIELEDRRSGATTFLRARAVQAALSAYVGDLAVADEQIRAVQHDMVADGNEVDLVWADNRTAAIATWSGRYADAERAARAAVQRAEQLGAKMSLLTAWTKRGTVAAYQGRESDARADARAAIDAARSIGAHRQVKEPTRTLALLEVSLGNHEAALDALRPMLDAFDPPHELEIEGGEHLPDAIEALVALGRLDEAEKLVTALETHGARRDRPWMLAVGARGRGAVLAARGELDAAQDALERAMTHHDRLPMPFERARTQLLLGQLLRRRRLRGPATDALTAACDAFDRLGNTLWAARARTELARLTTARGDGRQLTAGERRTADLAAQGLSNRQIAAELFLAEKSVEATLSSVYRKLGIRSRAGLGPALNADGGRTLP